jgi:elongator complex protein 3
VSHKRTLDLDTHREGLLFVLRGVIQDEITAAQLDKLVRAAAKTTHEVYGRDDLIRAYRVFTESGDLPPFDAAVIERLRMKPVRSSSGVTPVTVLTKPFPCPGECIFCPNDVRMPKSYLRDEPGAQRAEHNHFDPYLQTYTRLQAYRNIGHPTDKIEVIVLGGTWSFYPETYQIWFIRRIFDALHDFGAGVDGRAAVIAALERESQFAASGELPNVVIHGEAMAHTYNHVVQHVYPREIERARNAAAAFADERRARSVIDEYATWEELEAAHRFNEDAPCRCVGLVVETRPDHIDADEVRRVRRLGCTKVQIGFQSLDDRILRVNKRGHTVAATRRAVRLLRAGGFKIHAHWMPNLYGATPESDLDDYKRLFGDHDFRPDELKIYPCSLIESAELMTQYRAGTWQPYTHKELLDLLTACFRHTPEYARLTRVIRDIPGTDIVTGNKATNFRQLVENELAKHGEHGSDIRAREVRLRDVRADDLTLDEVTYHTSHGREVFLQFITDQRAIAGFLRLSLPDRDQAPLVQELSGAAMIREVHVYGQAVEIGESTPGRAQHAGLGTALIERAAAIAREHGYTRLAVISAVGTRGYYRKRGFVDGALYQIREFV